MIAGVVAGGKFQEVLIGLRKKSTETPDSDATAKRALTTLWKKMKELDRLETDPNAESHAQCLVVLEDLPVHLKQTHDYVSSIMQTEDTHRDVINFNSIIESIANYCRASVMTGVQLVYDSWTHSVKGGDASNHHEELRQLSQRTDKVHLPAMQAAWEEDVVFIQQCRSLMQRLLQVVAASAALAKYFVPDTDLDEQQFHDAVRDRATLHRLVEESGVTLATVVDTECEQTWHAKFSEYATRFNLDSKGSNVCLSEIKSMKQKMVALLATTDVSKLSSLDIGSFRHSCKEDVIMHISRLTAFSTTPTRDKDAIQFYPVAVNLLLAQPHLESISNKTGAFTPQDVHALSMALTAKEAVGRLESEQLQTTLEWLCTDGAVAATCKELLKSLVSVASAPTEAFQACALAKLRNPHKQLDKMLVKADASDEELYQKYSPAETTPKYLKCLAARDAAVAELTSVGESMCKIAGLTEADDTLRRAEIQVNKYSALVLLKRKHINHPRKGTKLRAELKEILDSISESDMAKHFAEKDAAFLELVKSTVQRKYVEQDEDDDDVAAAAPKKTGSASASGCA